MKELSPALDLDQEVEAITKFLTQKWTPRADLRALVSAIRDDAMQASRAFVERFSLGAAAHEMEKTRTALLEAAGAGPDAGYYDAYCFFLDRVWYFDDALYDLGLNLDGPWDFERHTKRLSARLSEQFPGLAAMTPQGFDAVAGADEHALAEEYSSAADQALFEGSKAEGVLSGTFPWRVSLPVVLVTSRNGLAPWHQLVGAVFGHFMCIAQFLNTRQVLDALTKAIPVEVGEVQFSLPKIDANPFLQVLLSWAGPAPSREAYEGAEMVRQSLKLPSEERAAFVQAHPERKAAYLESLAVFRQRQDFREPRARAQMLQELAQAFSPKA